MCPLFQHGDLDLRILSRTFTCEVVKVFTETLFGFVPAPAGHISQRGDLRADHVFMQPLG
jgi:hypothetical protein